MHLEHIWFDCDGTLYVQTPEMSARRDEATCSAISEKLNQPKDKVMERFREGRRNRGTRALSIKYEFGFSDEESRKLANASDISDLVQADPLLNEKFISLKQKGLKISIYTNSLRPRLTDILAKLGISSALFSYMMTIEEGGGKPAGYDEIIVRSKCYPFEMMFVGDNLQADIEPARRRRMHTLLVGAEKPLMDRSEEYGTYHFKRKTIYEIVPVTEELERLSQL